jgi:hypothetical protein
LRNDEGRSIFSTKHTSILSETALDEYFFIILEILGRSVYGVFFFNENIHQGSGFILGANEYAESELTNELAEGGAKPPAGQIGESREGAEGSTRVNAGT